MDELRVWAPGHERVDAVLDDASAAMAEAGGGWWSARIGDLPAGTRYRFSVDGGPARPDPRSRWQPEGIGGPSAVYDHAAFAWSDGAWRGRRLAASPIYELHVGTFTPEGTFDAAIARLDHLVDLGIGAVELLPVAEYGGERGWGYDGVLLWAVHHAYGGPDGLKALVDAAHARSIAVILDVVYNHLGPAGNHLADFGPYFTDRYATPWGQAVNVDGAGSDGVRRFVIDNACAWLEDYHLDGLRLDAVHAIVDESALHLLEELATTVAALEERTGRTRWLIAESDRNDPRLVASTEAGGYGLDAVWSDDFHHAVHAALTGERSGYYVDFGSLDDIAAALARVYVYGRRWSPFRQRHHGRPVGSRPGSRFLAYAQNHDQIGNRAAGERLAALVSPGRAKIAAALTLTGPGLPMLFQGEEWGASTPWQYFTDHQDPELGRAVSEGRRGEFASFGWAPDDVPDPQDAATFERSRLDWDELGDGVHASLLTWHRDLLALRRRVGDLTDGRLDAVRVEASETWLRMERGSVTVALNIGSSTVDVAVTPGAGTTLASDPAVTVDPAGGAVTLPPDTVVVLHRG